MGTCGHCLQLAMFRLLRFRYASRWLDSPRHISDGWGLAICTIVLQLEMLIQQMGVILWAFSKTRVQSTYILIIFTYSEDRTNISRIHAILPGEMREEHRIIVYAAISANNHVYAEGTHLSNGLQLREPIHRLFFSPLLLLDRKHHMHSVLFPASYTLS